MTGIEVIGLDELTNEFEEMQRNAEEIGGENEIDIYELIDQDFINKYTEFKNIDDIFDSFRLGINSEEFTSIENSKEWNEYIRSKTKFDSWNDMLGEAIAIFFMRKVRL